MNNKSFLKGALTGALIMLIIGVLAVGSFLLGVVGAGRFSVFDVSMITKLGVMEQYVDDLFLYDVDKDALKEWIYKGYVAGLDDIYAGYYTVEETQELMETTTGEYLGIGALMSQNMETGVVTLINVFNESPAEKAGLLDGDFLYKVDGEDIAGEDLTNIVSKVKGEEGTSVEITVLRGEELKEITVQVERGLVETETVEYELMEDGVGYIKISEFDLVTLGQYEKALENLSEQGMERLVIDLRNNPGGNLDTVCDMLRLMLPEGLIVYTKDKDGNVEEEHCDGSNEFDMPLVVLTNGYSASAAEIFAGAIQDYEIGTIVGETTFGKGIVQTLITLPDQSLLKITTSEYYTPAGRNIHGTGIEPDIEVIEEDINDEEDQQLKAAIDVLK